jgi:hypothetical protein
VRDEHGNEVVMRCTKERVVLEFTDAGPTYVRQRGRAGGEPGNAPSIGGVRPLWTPITTESTSAGAP